MPLSSTTFKRFLPITIFVLLVLLLFIGLTLNPRIVPSALIGKPVPKFTVTLLEDSSAAFTENDFIGQVTILNVWASWCFACRQEHAMIKSLSERGYRVIGLNYKDEAVNAITWLTQLGNPYQVNLHDLDGRVGIEWGVYGAPETFIIDKEGIIRYKHIGPVTPEVIENEIVPLINNINV